MEHVVAFDPGGRSGWASAKMDSDHFEFTGSGVLREDFMPDWFADQQRITYDLRVDPQRFRVFDVMVYESWYPRRDDQGKMDWIENNPLMAAQQIGALRWIARASHAKIVTQHPKDKPIAVATMPKVFADLDKDSNEQHDKDARMHLWLYFWRNWFEGNARPDEVFVGV
jgi:hypothetical protein